MKGIILGAALLIVIEFGCIYGWYQIRLARMEKEYKRIFEEQREQFEQFLREARMEAGLDPEKGCPEVIDMSHLFEGIEK